MTQFNINLDKSRLKNNATAIRDFAKISFSLFGEDRLLLKLFQKKISTHSPGFYVDIGCGHPYRNSNTALFYLHGWKGLVVDPNEVHMSEYAKCRPEDIRVRAGVGLSSGVGVFHKHAENDEMGWTTDLGHSLDTNHPSGDLVEIFSLKDLLRRYIDDEIGKIDLLDIDAEGRDLDMLQSNDWDMYRPEVICVEDHGPYGEAFKESEIYKILREVGYLCHSTAFITKIFVLETFKRW